jgi:AsmA protein
MRKLSIGVAFVLLLAVVASAAFLFVPSPLQKWAVERGASLGTGRQVSFGEPFRLHAWPPLTITAADVRVANADWGRAPELARIEALEAHVDLLAFWRENRVAIERLVVRRPQLNLEVAEDGRQNWVFGDGAATDTPSEQPAEVKPIPGFVLGDIRIEGGLVTYDDRTSDLRRRAEEIDLAIAQAGAERPVTLDGGLTMEGKRATLVGTVARPSGVAAGETSPVVLELRVPGGAVKFDGTVDTAAPAMAGRTEIDLPALRELLAWLGQELALPGGALRTAGLQTRLALTAERVALDDLRLSVDEVTGTGRAAMRFGDPAAVNGELALGRLDLTPYLPTTPAGGQPSSVAGAPASASDGGWSEAPIALPLPLPIDVDFRVWAEGLKAAELELGAVNTRLQADRRQATVTLDELQAYGGRLTGDARARPANPPAYALDLQSQGIHLLAALQALTGQARVDGRADLRLALAASGTNQRDLVRSLGGDGKLLLRDGAILGVNIAGMLRQLMTLGLSPVASQQRRTDFAEAGGSFRIQNGILRNDDLNLRAPVLRLEGAGTVDLRRRTLDYRIRPQIAATLEGQGAGGTPTLQAGVPFLVQGPLTAPSVRFDLNGTLTDAVSSPADLARVAADLAKNPQAVRTLRDQFDLLDQLPASTAGKAREVIEGVLGGGGGGRPQGAQPKGPPSLEDTARGLLKGFSR